MSKETTIQISKETLETLLKNFYKVCALCDELNIYEYDSMDDSMQEMKEWAEDKFGREINKDKYE